MIRVQKNKYKGRRCFIIASGPSMKGMDLSWLENEVTICVNESYKLLPFDPTFICISDERLWPCIEEKYTTLKNTGVVCLSGVDDSIGKNYKGDNMVARIRVNKNKTIARDGFVWNPMKGFNRGFTVVADTAVPFACWCGFDKCYLLGCDCSMGGYAFDDPIRGKASQRFRPKALGSFETIANIQKIPTKIINATRGGNLHCFPRTEWPPKEPLLVTGFYTDGGNYKELAEGMQRSVERFDLPCVIKKKHRDIPKHIQQKKPMPWVLNCSLCSDHILDVRKNNPGKDILYLDADAVMERRPSMFLDFARNYDFAAPFIDHGPNKSVPKINGVPEGLELISNTLYFAATPEADELLAVWNYLQNDKNKRMLSGEFAKPYRQAWDQVTLLEAVFSVKALRYIELPWEYAKIERLPSGRELMPGVSSAEIVISQHQASRQTKGII